MAFASIQFCGGVIATWHPNPQVGLTISDGDVQVTLGPEALQAIQDAQRRMDRQHIKLEVA